MKYPLDPASAVPEREGGRRNVPCPTCSHPAHAEGACPICRDELGIVASPCVYSVPASGEREGEGTPDLRIALRYAAQAADDYREGYERRVAERIVRELSAALSSAPPVDAPAPSETEIVNRIVAGLSDTTLAKFACWGPQACDHPRSEHEAPIAALLLAALDSSRSARVDAPADGGEYPPITLNECDSFERHAEHGAKADPSGEGVEYALIQPYDLVRFCHTVRELRAQLTAALRADREDAERWRWYAANADRWKLGYVALRGKWYCEGPDDALLDERFASAEEAIDAARRSQGGEPNV